MEARSLFFEQELLDFEVRDLEEEIKTQVCGLKDKDRLDQSTETRQALSDALQGVLVAIANRQPPNVLLEKLMKVEELRKALTEIEKGFEGPKDALKVCTIDALRKLIGEYGGQFIGDLQKRSFSDSSSLMDLHQREAGRREQRLLGGAAEAGESPDGAVRAAGPHLHLGHDPAFGDEGKMT